MPSENSGDRIAIIRKIESTEDGQGVCLTVELHSGEERVLLAMPEVLGELVQQLREINDPASRDRLARAANINRPGVLDTSEIKPAEGWEFATDYGKRAAVIGARHRDGTVTQIAIPARDIPDIRDRLRKQLKKLRSGGPYRDRENW